MEQITLNMIPKGITPICHASQYDKGRVIRLNIMDGLQGYVLSNESVQLNVRKPDMNIVTTDVDTTSGNTFVDIVTTEQMTACEGDNLCEIVLSAGDVVIASLNFIMRVEVDVLKDGIESETEIHNLTTQIQAINEEIVPQMVAEEVENQYDSENVIFDSTPTTGHGNGYAVTSEGVKAYVDNKPNALVDLTDVDIDNPTSNQALVWDTTEQKWKNGEVSTVGSIDDLDDVDTTGKIEGDNLRYDGNEWVAKPNTIEMTLAEWNAIADKQTWRNAHKNTYLVITDAPNLNETAKQISYDGGTDTVWDKVEGLGVSGAITPTSTKGTFSACYQSVIGDMVIVQGVFACNSNISAGGGVAFTLPYGLKTNTNASNFLMYDNTAGVNIHVRIANNGDVTPVDSMTTHSYRFTFAYLK